MLPIFQTSDRNLSMLQTKWASELNPMLALPTSNPSILQGITLVSGTNVVNHKLGRKPIGYIIIDSNSAVTVYRTQPFNDLTLTLSASGASTVTLMIF